MVSLTLLPYALSQVASDKKKSRPHRIINTRPVPRRLQQGAGSGPRALDAPARLHPVVVQSACLAVAAAMPILQQLHPVVITQRCCPAVVAEMIEYRCASYAIPPIAWPRVGPMYPSRPVVRPDSSHMLLMSHTAQQFSVSHFTPSGGDLKKENGPAKNKHMFPRPFLGVLLRVWCANR